jgi:signal recognition particle receptor subunit alpha
VRSQRSGDNSYALEPYMLKWVFANEVDLVFVAVYLNIAPLPYIDQLLEVVKKEFVGAFKEQIDEFDVRLGWSNFLLFCST